MSEALNEYFKKIRAMREGARVARGAPRVTVRDTANLIREGVGVLSHQKVEGVLNQRINPQQVQGNNPQQTQPQTQGLGLGQGIMNAVKQRIQGLQQRSQQTQEQTQQQQSREKKRPSGSTKKGELRRSSVQVD